MSIFGNSDEEQASEQEEDGEEPDEQHEQENHEEQMSEFSEEMDKMSKRLDDLETATERRESEMSELQDSLQKQDERVEKMDEMLKQMMDMYDDFAAGVNPLTKTEEQEVAVEQSDEQVRDEPVEQHDHEEQSVGTRKVKAGIYPVTSITGGDSELFEKILEVSESQRSLVLDEMVEHGFISHEVSESIRDEVSVHQHDDSTEHPSPKYYEDLITRLAEQ